MSGSIPQIRVGFFGAGPWARTNHLPAISHVAKYYSNQFDVSIAALCEKDPELAALAAKEFGIETSYSDPREFVRDAKINCFVVVVRPGKLRPLIDLFSRRSLPIMTEKPPGSSVKDARYFSEKVSVPNLVAFNRRYYPLNRRFAELVAGLDAPYYVHATMLRNERYDGVQGHDLEPFVVGTGIHLIDLLRSLFGDVASARTVIQEIPENGTRCWHVDIEFGAGELGRLDLLPCSGSHSETIEVHNRSTSMFLSGCQYGDIEPPGKIVIHRNGSDVETITGDPLQPKIVSAGFVDEYLDFFRAVAGGPDARSTFRTSLQSMELAEAIERGENFPGTGVR